MIAKTALAAALPDPRGATKISIRGSENCPESATRACGGAKPPSPEPPAGRPEIFVRGVY